MSHLTCAILGSSAAGVAIALAAADADCAVTICEPDPHARERAQVFARKDDADAAARVVFSDSYEAAESVDVVFDALDEDARDAAPCALGAGAVFLTPAAMPMPGVNAARAVRFVPFQPLQLRRLTELTAFPASDPAATDRTLAFANRIGRIPVTLPTGCPSVGLRLLDRLHDAADALLLEGAVLWELDETMTAFGFDLGFYEAQDLTGLDTAYARRKARKAPSKIADRAVEEGRIGKKIGWGWYRYPGGGGAVIDPLIEDLIREEAWFAKVPQRSFDSDEIVSALLDAMREEVSSILTGGSISSPDDMARVLVHGLGYPKGRLDLLALPADQRGSSAG